MEISKNFLATLLPRHNKDLILKLLQIKKEIDHLVNFSVFEDNLDIRRLVGMLQKVQKEFQDELQHLKCSPEKWISTLGRYLQSPLLSSIFEVENSDNGFVVYIRCDNKHLPYINYLNDLSKLLEKVFQSDFIYDCDDPTFFL